jgi:PAS domain S-box-containing protein
MEQELNTSFFKLFFDNSIEFLCVVDQKYNLIKVNKEWERSLAYSQSELEGKPFLEFVHPDDIKTTQELFKQVSAVGRVECFHNRLKHKNGLYHWLEWRWVFEGLYIMASASDISARKAKEEDIIRDKHFMEESQKLAKIGVWETDLVNNKLLLNDSAMRIYGYHEIKENLSFDFFLEHIHPNDLEYAKKAWNETITKGKFSDIEYRIRSKDGKLKTILISGNMELGDDKQPIRAYGIIQDVTRQKEIENNLRASQKILNEAERIAKMGSWQILLSDGTAIWSENLYKIHGMKVVPPALEPEWLLSVVHPDDRDKMAKNFQRNIERGFVENDEYRVVHPDGSVHILSVTGEVIKDAGVPTGHMIGVTQDITERRQAEEKIQRLLSAIDQTTVQIIITDRNNKVEYVNNKFCQVTGYDHEELIGHNAEFFSADENELGVQTEIITCIEQGKIFKGELLNNNAKGEPCWELVSITPIHNSNGELTNYIIIKEDITERKKMEKDILKAKENAEESDRLKTAFLQNVSHEIRTPMNAIMGFSSLLAMNFNNKEKLENFSKIIDQRCNDLLNIINDILDISKIESGQNTLNFEPCNINELFDEINLFFNDCKSRLNKQHINLSFHSPEGSFSNIKTDKLKLKQVLINLITNALKFTETGSIKCSCKPESDKLLFQVSDTGIGIPEDKFDYIFERFSQLKHTTIQNIGGTGLGLPIVKGLVELLGGKVWLESECNKNTTFFFTIDHIKVDTIPDPMINIEFKYEFNTNKTILIVEDDIYNAEYLKEILKDVTSNIYTVVNGLSAVKIVHEQKIDIILMDIRLPDISGYEATQLILQDKPKIKIIAQTAYASNTEQQKAIEAGCVNYISKPTKHEELLKILKKYII